MYRRVGRAFASFLKRVWRKLTDGVFSFARLGVGVEGKEAQAEKRKKESQ